MQCGIWVCEHDVTGGNMEVVQSVSPSKLGGAFQELKVSMQGEEVYVGGVRAAARWAEADGADADRVTEYGGGW
ncbi:hypothetical protein L6452_05671 [Arctium lappa]|uniref:Uncharacterized protein n=1 Tax=Arctium lappa TaxID=4217 RepID=A0ACB9EHC2_ARCLA|nr:hypothetical protein L6452_05671 [Arctium lappa]